MRWSLGVIAFLALVLTACSGHQGNDSTTPSVVATATPPATPSEAVFRSTASPLTRSIHSPGDSVDVDYGVLFMDVADGSIELWSLAGQVADDAVWLEPSRDGRLLVLQTGRDPVRRYVVRRDSGEAFEIMGNWSPDISVGFENVIGAWNGLDRAQFVLLDVARQEVVSTDIDRQRMYESSRVSRVDGKEFVVGDGTEFRLVDATKGMSRLVKDGLQGYRAQALDAGRGFLLAVYTGGDTVYFFDWDGNAVPAMYPNGLSPDGTLRATRQSPGRIQAFGMGGFPVLDAVTISNAATGRPVARFLGGSFNQWAADSRTLLVGDEQGGLGNRRC